MSISSSLFNNLQNTGKTASAPSASERAGLLTSTNTESSTSFSQMLRDTNKPVMPAPAPTPTSAANAAPKPPARPSEVRTETQRQEAKAAGKRPNSGEAAKMPAAPAPQTARAADAGKAPVTGDKVDAKVEGDETVAADNKTDKDEPQVAGDEVHALASPAAPIELAPVVPASASPQILALLAKAGIAPDGSAVKPDSSAMAEGGEDTPAVTTNARGTPGRADGAQAAGRASAADDKLSAELVTRDFTAELQDAASALPQALQTLKGAGPARGEGASVEGLLSASAAPPGAAVNQTAAPDTPTITLAQPLYEPGFAPELAARVSLLAADGVQEAQLHLNPAEMGPVAVQIVVDGQQAQVSFHAEHADTRAALEQSLPDLAAALRDSGLTLSGGGVFQQSREQHPAAQQRQGDGSGDRRSSRIGGDDGGVVSTRSMPAPRVSRGVLDLYA